MYIAMYLGNVTLCVPMSVYVYCHVLGQCDIVGHYVYPCQFIYIAMYCGNVTLRDIMCTHVNLCTSSCIWVV